VPRSDRHSLHRFHDGQARRTTCRTPRTSQASLASLSFLTVDKRKEATMRFLIKVEMPVEKGNSAAREGMLGKKIQAILQDQKPEAADVIAFNGKRTGLLFLDLQEPSQIPAIAEPWFLAFNADIEATPAMIPEDLEKAGPSIEKAVKKFG